MPIFRSSLFGGRGAPGRPGPGPGRRGGVLSALRVFLERVFPDHLIESESSLYILLADPITFHISRGRGFLPRTYY